MRRGSGSAEATALEGRSRRRAPNRNWLQSIWRVPYLQLAAPARHASWDVIRMPPKLCSILDCLEGLDVRPAGVGDTKRGRRRISGA